MGRLRECTTREARDPAFALLLAAIAVCLVKAVDQPGLSVCARRHVRSARGSATSSLPRSPIAVGLRVVAQTRLSRGRPLALTVAAAAFAALIVVTALANGGTAFVAAGKLVDARRRSSSGCIVLIDSTDRLWVVVGVIVARHRRRRRLGARRLRAAPR